MSLTRLLVYGKLDDSSDGRGEITAIMQGHPSFASVAGSDISRYESSGYTIVGRRMANMWRGHVWQGR